MAAVESLDIISPVREAFAKARLLDLDRVCGPLVISATGSRRMDGSESVGLPPMFRAWTWGGRWLACSSARLILLRPHISAMASMDELASGPTEARMSWMEKLSSGGNFGDPESILGLGFFVMSVLDGARTSTGLDLVTDEDSGGVS